MNDVARLNERFAVAGHVAFEAGEGGMPRAVVSNDLAQATVYLHGAHVTAFQPRGHAPVLWTSELAEFRAGKAIRGGIPLVWPWFGPHPTDESLPQHGFARVAEWGVASTRALDDGRTEVVLELSDDARTRAHWPRPFALEVRVTVGMNLEVALTNRNTGAQPVRVGAALHTYFFVGDVTSARIGGLEGREYIDQVNRRLVKRQRGSLAFTGEVDRVYLDTPDECVVADPILGRRIRVAKAGSRTTVVWNPWVEKARKLVDFPDEHYTTMVCVEAANAEGDVRSIPPGGSHTLSQAISVENV